MEIENLTNPGVPPVHGDLIRITYTNGMIEEKEFVDLPYEEPPPSYRDLTKADFTALVSTGLTSAQKLALRKNADMELAWMQIDDLANVIPRSHPFTNEFLDTAIDLALLTTAQRETVLTEWHQV